MQFKCVPCYDVKTKLEKIEHSRNQEELDEVITDFEERFEAGYQTFKVDYDDKDYFINKVATHWVVVKPMMEIEQFKKGFNSFNVLESFQNHAEGIREFVYDPLNIYNNLIKNMFEIEYSSQTSEQRTSEESIIFNWNNFLDEVHERHVEEVKVAQENERGYFCLEQHRKITLEDVLMFLSGSKYPPLVGFKKGKILFQ